MSVKAVYHNNHSMQQVTILLDVPLSQRDSLIKLEGFLSSLSSETLFRNENDLLNVLKFRLIKQENTEVQLSRI